MRPQAVFENLKYICIVYSILLSKKYLGIMQIESSVLWINTNHRVFYGENNSTPKGKIPVLQI